MDRNAKIEELNFSVRTYNCLKRANINTVGELLDKSTDELKRIRNLGGWCLDEILNAEKKLGIDIPDTPSRKRSLSADQMFSNIGYERTAVPHADYPYYMNDCGVRIEVCPHGDGISKYEVVEVVGGRHSVKCLPFTVDELIACAQSIKEMNAWK